MLHRGKRVCSTEQLFQEEVKRIKQLLVDNNVSMKLIDNHVTKFSQSQNTTETQVIQLYYRNQMRSNARVEKGSMKDLVSKHL